MNANEVIDSYVEDVTKRLPRKQRDDVAFELRELLDEGLQAQADAAGRSPDAEMATAFARAFGHPRDVAARYRAPLHIVDPADAHLFVRSTVVGMAVIWGLGLVLHLSRPIASGSDLLVALGAWWGNTVLGSLWWPGALVVGFGLAAWGRRRRPRTSEWSPKTPDDLDRSLLALAVVGIVCGLTVLVDPRLLLDAVWSDLAPVVYDAFTYTPTFRERQALPLLLLLALHVPLLVAAMIQGRWSASLRRLWRGLSVALCAVLAWAVLDGPVVIAPESDGMIKLGMVVTIAGTLLDFGVRWLRRVRPAPEISRSA